MNEKLQAFRKRLAGPERAKTPWQSWIGSPTAWLALLLSVANSFYSVVYRSDELSVVVSSDAAMNIVDYKFGIRPPSHLTFINTGTRPIAILDARLYGVQPPAALVKGKLSCNDGRIERVEVNFEQHVIKPGDTVAVGMSLRGSKEISGDGYRQFPIMRAGDASDPPPLIVCLSFELVATDDEFYRKTVELIRTDRDIRESSHARFYLIKRNRFWTSIGPDDLSVVLDLMWNN